MRLDVQLVDRRSGKVIWREAAMEEQASYAVSGDPLEMRYTEQTGSGENCRPPGKKNLFENHGTILMSDDLQPDDVLKAAKKEQVAPFYLFYGPGEFRMERVLATLKTLLVPEAVRDFNLEVLYGDDKIGDQHIEPERNHQQGQFRAFPCPAPPHYSAKDGILHRRSTGEDSFPILKNPRRPPV